MSVQPTTVDFTDQDLYVGIDVHKKDWKVSIHTATREHRTFTQPPHASALLQYLQRHFPGARYHCAYEAGFSGFRAARELRAGGVACLVVHAADIPKTQRDQTRKNDQNDARRLARALRAGTLRSVYVPSAAAVEARALVRQRRDCVKKQTRCKVQIRMLLYQLGWEIPAELVKRYWSRRFLAWLEGLELDTPAGTQALRTLLDEVEFQRAQVLQVTRALRALAETAPFRAQVALLRTIPGIGIVSAMVLVTELIAMERFPTADALASYVGLIPGEHSSGARVRTTGLTRRRNAALRHIVIEAAWVASGKDPALLAVYTQAKQRMAKNKAIVLVARRLLNRIRVVWLTGAPYEMGRTQGTWPRSPQAGPGRLTLRPSGR